MYKRKVFRNEIDSSTVSLEPYFLNLLH